MKGPECWVEGLGFRVAKGTPVAWVRTGGISLRRFGENTTMNCSQNQESLTVLCVGLSPTGVLNMQENGPP